MRAWRGHRHANRLPHGRVRRDRRTSCSGAVGPSQPGSRRTRPRKTELGTGNSAIDVVLRTRILEQDENEAVMSNVEKLSIALTPEIASFVRELVEAGE